MGALELNESVIALRIQSHRLGGYMYVGKKMLAIVMSLIRGLCGGKSSYSARRAPILESSGFNVDYTTGGWVHAEDSDGIREA